MKPTMKLSFAFTLLLISIPASCQTENKAAMQAPRDRSLVTVSALIASGQVAQVGSPQSSHGQWPHSNTSFGSPQTTGVLCGLAQRLLRTACRERSVCEARPIDT